MVLHEFHKGNWMLEKEILDRAANIDGVEKPVSVIPNGDNGIFLMPARPDSISLLEHIFAHGTRMSLSDRSCKHLFKQIYKIVCDLRDIGIVHRNLICDNVLVDQATLKVSLIGFIRADYTSKSPFRNMVGHIRDQPPEWFLNNAVSAESLSVWALGLLLYIMMYGSSPFASKADILRGEIPTQRGGSPDALDLVKECLRTDANERYTLNNIRYHRWMEDDS